MHCKLLQSWTWVGSIHGLSWEITAYSWVGSKNFWLGWVVFQKNGPTSNAELLKSNLTDNESAELYGHRPWTRRTLPIGTTRCSRPSCRCDPTRAGRVGCTPRRSAGREAASLRGPPHDSWLRASERRYRTLPSTAHCTPTTSASILYTQ